jgi:hypothetical protein
MDCSQLADAAAELALGVLPGDERAAALAHLDRCPACQQLVAAVTGATDQLLAAMVPSVEPPPGFERRVLSALTEPVPARTPARRPRRVAGLASVAAVLAALTLVLGIPRVSGPTVVAAEMRTPAGAVVGQVYLHEGSPAVVSMRLPGWAARLDGYGADASYAVRVELTEGADRLLPVTVNEDSSWAAALDVDPHTVRAVAVVDGQGNVWCQARLSGG